MVAVTGLFLAIESVLEGFGYAALFGMVFAESGLFFGFFLPGDSLLFIAGLLAAQGFFDIRIALMGVAVSAILGDQVGYWMGHRFGRRFFNKPSSPFRTPAHIRDAEIFFAKHGKKAVVFARFVPVVRTFAPIVAGIGRMEYGAFVAFNIIGGVLWSVTLLLAGYFLATAFPQALDFISLLVVVVLIITTFPIVGALLGRMKKAKLHK